MVIIISSRVNDSLTLCKLHCSLSRLVCFTDAHYVYTSPCHFSRCLCNVATSVKCPYVLVAYLHGVFRVYQWLDQPGDVLLALAPVHHQFSPTRYCHSSPLKWWIHSASGFCNKSFFYGRGVSALCPTPNLEGQWDHSLSGPCPSTCFGSGVPPGVQDSSQHSSRGHWARKPPHHVQGAIPSEAGTKQQWNKKHFKVVPTIQALQ